MKYLEVELQIKARCGEQTNKPVARVMGQEDTHLWSKPELPKGLLEAQYLLVWIKLLLCHLQTGLGSTVR